MLSVHRNHPWQAFDKLMRNSMNLGRDLDRMFLNPLTRQRDSFAGWPQFNLWTNDDEIIVTAEVPGLEADQIDVDINNNQLTVSATVEAPELAEGESYQRRERFSGSFERTLRLPFAVDQEKSEARYVDGVLEIRLSKPERDKPRKLSVKAG
ncbi:MAG: Hsp20/alpha crystallin family protein [Planctomycetaceae bacterium]|nr:Hsp20/alpha crystallin family protein [Planctomycetaceae bacterium]